MAAILGQPGRVLFLSEDPALIVAQLAGRELSRAEAGKLRDDVSTDEITPPTTCLLYDERLGREVLIGLRTGERTPIAKDALKGKFSVVAGGKRYGKGSSREHAPLAHLHAGVQLIVAESFERIFRQNADNLGLFTSTDFGLIEQAVEANAHQVLGASHVVLAYDSPACNLALPITNYTGLMDSAALTRLGKNGTSKAI